MSERLSSTRKTETNPENFQQDNPLKRRSDNKGSLTSNAPPPPPRKSENSSRINSNSYYENNNNNNNYENNNYNNNGTNSSRESRSSSVRGNNKNNGSNGITKLDIPSHESAPINLATHNPIDMQSPKSPTSPTASTAPLTTRASIDSVSDSNDKTRPLQYGLWAHYMGYGSSLLCFWFGITAVLWADAHFYSCRVNGQPIDTSYILVNGTCGAIHKGNYVCCNPDDDAKVEGNMPVGAVYIVYGIFLMFIENYDWGYGLWFPKDSFIFKYRFSPIGLLHILIAIIGFTNYATAIAAFCLLTTGIVYNIATYRFETGDGGREQRKQERLKQTNNSKFSYLLSFLPDYQHINLNPMKFFRRIYQEDKLSSYIWLTLYFGLNFALFVYTLYAWDATAHGMRQGLIKGNLEYDCDTPLCDLARQVIRSGPISRYAPWAKACGGCLNLNCALILFPVTRLLLSKLYNVGTSYSRYQGNNSSVFTRFFAHPITRYVPLNKNIEFHKICAMSIFFFSWGHTICHCLNLARAAETTLWVFSAFGWVGTDFFTGAVVTVSMFFIYSAAPDIVRRAHFETFFSSHHFFVIFYLFMFQHGPVFIYWTAVPVILYIIERYLQSKRGNHPFVVTKVEWIPPVMALQIRPIHKEHFQFKEGQYLYLNCPYISPSEWHPFTISSAQDDLNNGPRLFIFQFIYLVSYFLIYIYVLLNIRVLLETGEEVVEAPRPADWPSDEK